jgi:hypothetical protein
LSQLLADAACISDTVLTPYQRPWLSFPVKGNLEKTSTKQPKEKFYLYLDQRFKSPPNPGKPGSKENPNQGFKLEKPNTFLQRYCTYPHRKDLTFCHIAFVFYICQLPGTPPWIFLLLSKQIDYVASEVLSCRSNQAEGAYKIS